jgi:glutamate/aspartate transport system substrate-binding protein
MMPTSTPIRATAGQGACRVHAGRVALVIGAVATGLLVGGLPAKAQTKAPAFEVPYTGTLKQIRDSGVIRVGYRENSPPFAFIGPDKKPVGYALDLCEVVIEEVASELQKDIRAEYRPVTPENRFDLIRSGAIDIECGSTTNNFERRKIVAFSPTMFVTGTKLLVKRGSGIRSLRDLQGKTVVLTRGTVHADAIPKLAQRQKLDINFITAADHNESFQMLASGKAQAFANDDIQLYGMIAQTKSGSEYRVVGDFLTYADYALMIRKDDAEFQDAVDRAFGRLAGSREIVAIYDKWFMKPLPSGLRLNLPMSPHLEELFKVHGLVTD